MRWFKRWYGANPLHLLGMLGCVTLTGYAAGGLLQVKPVAILIWFGGAVVGHDLILVPLYVLADRSVMTVFRHRPPRLLAVPWINYLRVPAALSGMLLLIWFPLIFRVPSRFPQTTDLSLNPYLGHWLAVTGVLFLLSAAAFALRLRPGRRAREARETRETPGTRDIPGTCDTPGSHRIRRPHEVYQSHEAYPSHESYRPHDAYQPQGTYEPHEPYRSDERYRSHERYGSQETHRPQGTYGSPETYGTRDRRETGGQRAAPTPTRLTGPDTMWPPRG
jgi:hypothetical protein